LENKNPNVTLPDTIDEDDIFAKTIACQLKKKTEPEKTKIKGQLMKILFDF